MCDAAAIAIYRGPSVIATTKAPPRSRQVSGGFLRFVDFTQPLCLPRADWVISLEVGEHVPAAQEKVPRSFADAAGIAPGSRRGGRWRVHVAQRTYT